MSTDTAAMPNTHILSTFEEALRSLRNDALMMASLTERNLENTRKGLFDRDEDWCNTAIADDEEVDTLEVQIDREGINIMLRFHPLASDMRDVISAMKLSVNLERIADQATNIARPPEPQADRASRRGRDSPASTDLSLRGNDVEGRRTLLCQP